MNHMQNDNEEQFRKRALKEAGISYSVCAVLPVLLSLVLLIVLMIAGVKDYGDAEWYKYLAYLIPQVSFACAAGIFFFRSKVSVKRSYRASKWYYFLIALVLQFGLLFSLSELNGYFIKFLKLFGYQEQESLVPELGGWNLLPALIVIAVLPAIFEETIFRGILSRYMSGSGWGLVSTVLISGALFSLFHHNPEQTLYQFVCGMCLTLVALRAGSVLPTICAHFANNAVILILGSFGYDSLSKSIPWGGYLAICIVSAVCLVGTLVYLVFFDKNGARKGGVKYGKLFFLAAGAGIIICAVEWIVQLVSGFIA